MVIGAMELKSLNMVAQYLGVEPIYACTASCLTQTMTLMLKLYVLCSARPSAQNIEELKSSQFTLPKSHVVLGIIYGF